MADPTRDPSPPSPLDPFLRPFLRAVEGMADGYSPISGGSAVAADLGWPPAFSEAVFASARGRGMVEPYRARGARGRARWRVSSRGAAWLAAGEGIAEVAALSAETEPTATSA